MTRPRDSAPGQARLVVTLTADELDNLIHDAVALAFARQSQSTASEKMPAHLTLQETATVLRCSVPSVRRLVARGRLRTVRLGHGGSSRVLIPRTAIDALVGAA